ncbi:hypothetical protein [Pelagibacterium halotolerans]|uniref:hypothetical protein n=1 Tax=Pelagibacterium halotolerans TaxID=531813 RepID=UPI000899F694|nr:hypothetical protein [Pelagibacterium halotolerans]QJR19698.1 hypothetical protein HKM20_15420 [Pelagibacterium halotolerans]SEA53317.1 hypothetical protein SAMN05428936_104346 [Pelagibacterium halotolerans]
MLSWPSLPTDNLYKFQAIAGLVLVVVSSIFMYLRVSEDALEVARISAVISSYETLLERDAEEIRAFREQLESREAENELDSVDLEGLQLRLSQFEELERQHRESAARISEDSALSRTRVDNTAMAHGPLFAMTIAGLIFMLHGFWLWYSRVQVHQDKLLRLQVEKIASDLSKRDE